MHSFFWNNRTKPTALDLADTLHQLADLSATGLSDSAAVNVIIEGNQQPVLIQSLRQVSLALEQGERLSHALAGQPTLFSPPVILLTQVAESSADKSAAMTRVAEYQDSTVRIQGGPRKGRFYLPSLGMAIFLLYLLLIFFVLPRTVAVVSTSARELPEVVQLLMAGAAFVRDYWYHGVILVFGVAAWIVVLRRRGSPLFLAIWKPFNRLFPRRVRIRRLEAILRFLVLCDTLLALGLSPKEAMGKAMLVLDDPDWVTQQEAILADVQVGIPFSQALAARDILPNPAPAMLFVAERTGQVPTTVRRLIERFSRQVVWERERSDRTTNLVGLLLVGCSVGGFYLIFYLSMAWSTLFR